MKLNFTAKILAVAMVAAQLVCAEPNPNTVNLSGSYNKSEWSLTDQFKWVETVTIESLELAVDAKKITLTPQRKPVCDDNGCKLTNGEMTFSECTSEMLAGPANAILTILNPSEIQNCSDVFGAPLCQVNSQIHLINVLISTKQCFQKIPARHSGSEPVTTNTMLLQATTPYKKFKVIQSDAIFYSVNGNQIVFFQCTYPLANEFVSGDFTMGEFIFVHPNGTASQKGLWLGTWNIRFQCDAERTAQSQSYTMVVGGLDDDSWEYSYTPIYAKRFELSGDYTHEREANGDFKVINATITFSGCTSPMPTSDRTIKTGTFYLLNGSIENCPRIDGTNLCSRPQFVVFATQVNFTC